MQRELLGVVESSTIMVMIVQLCKSTKKGCILRLKWEEWYVNYNSIKLFKKDQWKEKNVYGKMLGKNYERAYIFGSQ